MGSRSIVAKTNQQNIPRTPYTLNRVGNSLFHSSALRNFAQNRSFLGESLFKKNDSEPIALITLYCTKELPWANCSHRFLKKSNMSDLLMNPENCSQKPSDLLKNSYLSYSMFLTVFYCFPLFMPKSEWLPSLFVPSDWSDLLLSLFTTGDHEQIVNSLITKERLCMSDSLFFHEHITISLFRSQKTSDSLINQRANSQPYTLMHLL